MKKIYITLLTLFSLSFNILYSQTNPHFSGGIELGYANGLGIGMNFILKDFAEGFPFALKGGISVAFVDPGKPLDARKIFINDNTNGVPEKSGYVSDFRFDFMFPIGNRFYLFAGPRYSTFTGDFKFVDGNEDFEVTSNQWALGIGAQSYFKISSALDIALSAGYDYYFNDDLYGHDTTYSPDNENINARNGYEYKDADDAVNQPKGNLRVMFGVSFNL